MPLILLLTANSHDYTKIMQLCCPIYCTSSLPFCHVMKAFLNVLSDSTVVQYYCLGWPTMLILIVNFITNVKVSSILAN